MDVVNETINPNMSYGYQYINFQSTFNFSITNTLFSDIKNKQKKFKNYIWITQYLIICPPNQMVLFI